MEILLKDDIKKGAFVCLDFTRERDGIRYLHGRIIGIDKDGMDKTIFIEHNSPYHDGSNNYPTKYGEYQRTIRLNIDPDDDLVYSDNDEPIYKSDYSKFVRFSNQVSLRMSQAARNYGNVPIKAEPENKQPPIIDSQNRRRRYFIRPHINFNLHTSDEIPVDEVPMFDYD